MCGNWVKDVLGWEVRERKNDDRSIGNDNIRGGDNGREVETDVYVGNMNGESTHENLGHTLWNIISTAQLVMYVRQTRQ